MNLVGKIFIVLIFIMSLVFMSFVVAVYATHTHWRDVVMNQQATADKPLGLKPQLDQQKARNQELSDQLDKLKQEVATEKAAKRQQLAKLETENDELKKQRDQQEKELAKLVQAERDAVAAMDATQKTAEALRKEVEGLRDEVRNIQKDRDEQFKRVVDLTDQLHQTVNQLKSADARSKQLAADYANALAVLRKFELKPDPKVYEGTPPKVDGAVLAVTNAGLLEVSIGSDDGLIEGHKLEVYRFAQGVSTYLGRIEVTKVQPDKSVCKILPEFQKGQIQVGDSVASKLR